MKYRITQRVRMNTPAQHDGHLQIWVDGVVKFSSTAMCWRGDTSTNPLLTSDPKYNAAKRAAIDSFKYQNYYGGSDCDGPTYDSFVTFGEVYIWDSAPDFSVPLAP